MPETQLDRDLRALRWRQGDLIEPIPETAIAFHPVIPTTPGARREAERNPDLSWPAVARSSWGRSAAAVIVSHDCDIARHVEVQPVVEVMRVFRPTGGLGHYANYSIRMFVLSPTEPLIVEAKTRAWVEKAALLHAVRQAPADPPDLPRFRRWLRAQYDRPALPEHVNDHVRVPLQVRLDEAVQDPALASSFAHLRSVGIERLQEAAYYDVRLLFLYDEVEQDPDMVAAHLYFHLRDAYPHGGVAQLGEWRAETPVTISLHDTETYDQIWGEDSY